MNNKKSACLVTLLLVSGSLFGGNVGSILGGAKDMSTMDKVENVFPGENIGDPIGKSDRILFGPEISKKFDDLGREKAKQAIKAFREEVFKEVFVKTGLSEKEKVSFAMKLELEKLNNNWLENWNKTSKK